MIGFEPTTFSLGSLGAPVVSNETDAVKDCGDVPLPHPLPQQGESGGDVELVCDHPLPTQVETALLALLRAAATSLLTSR